MIYGIKILPDAQSDIREAIDWYNDQQDQLGKRFLRSLADTIQILATNPEIFQIKYKKIRQAPVRGFPFQVHYLVEEKKTQIIVIAVLHTSRNPQNWKNRT